LRPLKLCLAGTSCGPSVDFLWRCCGIFHRIYFNIPFKYLSNTGAKAMKIERCYGELNERD